MLSYWKFESVTVVLLKLFVFKLSISRPPLKNGVLVQELYVRPRDSMLSSAPTAERIRTLHRRTLLRTRKTSAEVTESLQV